MSEIRSVSSLPLAPHVIQLLTDHGFKFLSEIIELGPLDLARDLLIIDTEIKVPIEMSREIFRTISNSSTAVDTGGNALELLIKCSQEKPIITFCREIDRALGGGIPSGQVTEICGVPGIGKTQMGIQLALDVQIPSALKGREGEAVYIDTEGSFMVERVAGMAQALASHLLQIAAASPPGSAKARCAEGISCDSLLQGIHYFRVLDQTELQAVLHHLSAFLLDHPKIKLVVIDSIAFHFRQDLQNISGRNRILSSIAQKLNKCALGLNYPSIVVMNHVTTKIDKSTGRSSLTPALGDHWSHSITNRLILQWKDDQRMAYLVKSPNRPKARAPFAITSLGVRDITSSSNVPHQIPLPPPQQREETNGNHWNENSNQAEKRQRVR